MSFELMELNNVPIKFYETGDNTCRILIEGSKELKKNYIDGITFKIPEWLCGKKLLDVEFLGSFENPIHINKIEVNSSFAKIDISGEYDLDNTGKDAIKIGQIHENGNNNHINIVNSYIEYINPLPFKNFYTLINVGNTLRAESGEHDGRDVLYSCRLFMNKNNLSEAHIYAGPSNSNFSAISNASTLDINTSVLSFFKNIYCVGQENNLLNLGKLTIDSSNSNVIFDHVKLNELSNNGENNSIHISNSDCSSYYASEFTENLTINDSHIDSIFTSKILNQSAEKDIVNIDNSIIDNISIKKSKIYILGSIINNIALFGDSIDTTIQTSKINFLFNSSQNSINISNTNNKAITFFNSSLKAILSGEDLDITSNKYLETKFFDIDPIKETTFLPSRMSIDSGLLEETNHKPLDSIIRQFDPVLNPAFPHRIICKS